MGWCLCTPGSAEYILPVTLSTSATPVSPYARSRCLKMYLEAAMDSVWRYNWKLKSSDLRDVLGCRDWASLKMYLETERSSDPRVALGGQDGVSLKMHLKAEIEWTQWSTWKSYMTMLGDTLGGSDRSKLEEYLMAVDLEAIDMKAVNLEAVNREAVNLERVDREACALEAETVFICQLVIVGMWRIEYNMLQWELEDWLGAGDSRSWDNAVCGVCSTQSKQYSVYAVLGVCSTQCVLCSVYAGPSVCCTWCILYLVYAVFGVCCIWCMLYSVYTSLIVNSWLWHEDIERDVLTSCSSVTVELRARSREMSSAGQNDDASLRLRVCRVGVNSPSPIRQIRIPIHGGIYTDTRSSQPTQANCTPDSSYPLISFPSFWSSSPICLCLIHNSIIFRQHKLIHPSLSLDAMIMSWYRV